MNLSIICSAELADFAADFAKAQGELQNPTKDRINPHFKSKYADLASGFDVTRPILSKHGISILQLTEIHEGQVVLRTRLLHSSGQFMDGFYPVSPVSAHQPMGSAMTYAKRQALFAIVGIVGDDDDDGETAAEPAPIQRGAEPPKPSEPVADRLIAVMGKTDSAVALGEWWGNPKVAEAFASLSIADRARVEAAKAKRLSALEDDPFADERRAA